MIGFLLIAEYYQNLPGNWQKTPSLMNHKQSIPGAFHQCQDVVNCHGFIMLVFDFNVPYDNAGGAVFIRAFCFTDILFCGQNNQNCVADA